MNLNEIGRVPDLAAMADKMAIAEVINAYARGVDRADATLLKSTCWSDALLDYGFYQGDAHPFLDQLVVGLKQHVNTQHQISNLLVSLEGNNARAECYLTAHHHRRDNTEMTYIGRYLDLLEKRDQVWKIKWRRIVMTWHQDVAMTEDFDKNASLAAVARANNEESDPSWAFFAGEQPSYDFD